MRLMFAEKEDLERKHLVCFTDEACEPHELPMYVLTPAELEALKRQYFEAGVWAMGNNNDSGIDIEKEFAFYESTKK